MPRSNTLVHSKALYDTKAKVPRGLSETTKTKTVDRQPTDAGNEEKILHILSTAAPGVRLYHPVEQATAPLRYASLRPKDSRHTIIRRKQTKNTRHPQTNQATK